jgi:U3 small nucleolar RNA-associated protein 14
MVARAFAGEDVVGEFEAEKAAIAEDEDDKIVDNTLPGWGSWVGDGVSAKEKKRHQGRFLTKVDGIKKNNRKDAKLEKVMINEKRIKKVSSTEPPLLSYISCANTFAERSLPRKSAPSPLRVPTTVRALAASACRTRVADKGDVPGHHQASCAHEARHYHAHVEAYYLETCAYIFCYIHTLGVLRIKSMVY